MRRPPADRAPACVSQILVTYAQKLDPNQPTIACVFASPAAARRLLRCTTQKGIRYLPHDTTDRRVAAYDSRFTILCQRFFPRGVNPSSPAQLMQLAQVCRARASRVLLACAFRLCPTPDCVTCADGHGLLRRRATHPC